MEPRIKELVALLPDVSRRTFGRVAALPPSLIVRTWHHRPGRGSVCPDKETP
jgi:hypothetical protein